MKKIILFIAIGFLTFACGQKTSRKADVSNIDVEIKISRFDKDFWALKNSKNLGADPYCLSFSQTVLQVIYIQML